MSSMHFPRRAREQFAEMLDRMQAEGGTFSPTDDDRRVVLALAGDADGGESDTLPRAYCDQLDLPEGSDYRTAAARVMEEFDITEDDLGDPEDFGPTEPED